MDGEGEKDQKNPERNGEREMKNQSDACSVSNVKHENQSIANGRRKKEKRKR